MQAADLEKDCNSFTVCVVIGMFVLGVWGITLPFFSFSGTGLLNLNSIFKLNWIELKLNESCCLCHVFSPCPMRWIRRQWKLLLTHCTQKNLDLNKKSPWHTKQGYAIWPNMSSQGEHIYLHNYVPWTGGLQVHHWWSCDHRKNTASSQKQEFPDWFWNLFFFFYFF